MIKPQVAKRLEQCAGQDFESRDCRVTNPHITARESIELADYIAAIEAERDAMAVQVEQLRDAANPVVDDYFNWLEVNGIDTEDLQPSYKRIFDMMTALNNQLRLAAK